MLLVAPCRSAEALLEKVRESLESRVAQAEERTAFVAEDASKALGLLKGELQAAERRGKQRAADLEREVEALRRERGQERELHEGQAQKLQVSSDRAPFVLRSPFA